MHALGFTTAQKTLENQDLATGPAGRRSVASRERWPWAVGRGPWAVGRWPSAVGRGPPGHAVAGRGPWAAGLLLAKPGLTTPC